MKKVSMLFLIILCAFTIVACGGDGENAGGDPQGNAEDTQQDADEVASSVISGKAVKGPIEGAEMHLYYYGDDGAEIEIIAENAPVITQSSGSYEFQVNPETVAGITSPLVLRSTGGTMAGQSAPELEAIIADPGDLAEEGQAVSRHLSTASSVAARMLSTDTTAAQSAPSVEDAQACIEKVEEELAVDLTQDPSDVTKTVGMMNLNVDQNLDLSNHPENVVAVEEYIQYLAGNLKSASGKLDDKIEDPGHPGQDITADFSKIGKGHLAKLCPNGPSCFHRLWLWVNKDTIVADDVDAASIYIFLRNGWGRRIETAGEVELSIVAGEGWLSDTNPTLENGRAKVLFTSGTPGEVVILAKYTLCNDKTVTQCLVINVIDEDENVAPVADAGEDQTVSTGSVVTLDGSGSSDANNDPLTYAWSLVSAPEGSTAELSDSTTFDPTFTADLDGDYVFELIVNDGVLDSEPDSVTITAQTGSVAPSADAGPDQNVPTGTEVTLDGSASSDANNEPLTYEWSLVSAPEGSTAELSDPTSVSPTFTADLDGTYVAELIVDNGTQQSEPATVTITAGSGNSIPVADAGPDQNVAPGTEVTLDGSGSQDADGDELTYTWSLVTIPSGSTAELTDPESINPTFTADVEGAYEVELVVSDGVSNSEPATVTVTASTSNAVPVADAGPDQEVAPGDSVSLDGSASSDADGDELTFTWSLVTAPEGSGATLSDPGIFNPTFTADMEGTYVAELVVNDGETDSAPDSVTINATTANSPPVADAGPDQNVTTGSEVTLDGSASTDPDNDPLTYTWTIVTLPDGSSAELSDPEAMAPTFTADLDGTYEIELVVSDGISTSEPATVTITAESGNSAPTANAGPDQNVPTGTEVFLDGSGSQDADGDELTFTWSLVDVPSGSTAELSDENAVDPSFIADLEGTYVIELVVSDGITESEPVTVTVTASTANSAPVADAGPDQQAATLSSVLLDGTGSSDADGDELTYAWSLVSAPEGSTAVLSDPTTNETVFLTPDLEGDYVVQLIVSDGELDSEPDTATITAAAAPSEELDGEALYVEWCQSCHGADGTMNGNLTDMSAEELMSLLPHFGVTSDDIQGEDGAQAISDYITQ